MRFVRPITSVLLVKRDGSLWRWGGLDGRYETNSLAKTLPEPLEGAIGITHIAESPTRLYAWRGDEAYVIGAASLILGNPAGASERNDRLVMLRLPALDNHRWRSIARLHHAEIGVRDDGTLWTLKFPPSRDIPAVKLEQIAAEAAWRQVESHWSSSVAALKSDGSLWVLNVDVDGYPDSPVYQRPQRQLSVHKDWVALDELIGDSIAVSADGGLWYWRTAPAYWEESVLARSRAPGYLGNVLAPQ
jgi:hypothetical protein